MILKFIKEEKKMKYRVIEALLYVQGEQGLTSEQLQQSLKLEK